MKLAAMPSCLGGGDSGKSLESVKQAFASLSYVPNDPVKVRLLPLQHNKSSLKSR